MNTNFMTTLGIAGGIVAIVSLWGQLRGFFEFISSLFIVKVELFSWNSKQVQIYYLSQNFKPLRLLANSFSFMPGFIRPLKKRQEYALRVIGDSPSFFYKGWKFLWVHSPKGENHNTSMSFIRGMFNAEKLVLAMEDEYNCKPYFCRYATYRITGTRGKHGSKNQGPEQGVKMSSSAKDYINMPVRWKLEDIGNPKCEEIFIPQNESIRRLLDETRKWWDSEEWYTSRGLPHRRGWLFHGKPGSGKTILVRKIAESLDVPVYSYDLGSLYNDELYDAWTTMDRPCIALMEDIDAVFEGRKNITPGDGGLTFDCLLNCMDGIEDNHGLMLIINTNHIERVDNALRNRPGRIDRVVNLGDPDKRAYEELAKKMVGDVGMEKHVVEALKDNETMAQFQERLSRTAMKLLWEEEEEKEVPKNKVHRTLNELVGAIDE